MVGGHWSTFIARPLAAADDINALRTSALLSMLAFWYHRNGTLRGLKLGFADTILTPDHHHHYRQLRSSEMLKEDRDGNMVTSRRGRWRFGVEWGVVDPAGTCWKIKRVWVFNGLLVAEMNDGGHREKDTAFYGDGRGRCETDYQF